MNRECLACGELTTNPLICDRTGCHRTLAAMGEARLREINHEREVEDEPEERPNGSCITRVTNTGGGRRKVESSKPMA